MWIYRLVAAALAVLMVITPAEAADEPGYRVYTKSAKFEDVRDDVKDAIINRGFVIDYVGHLHAMLERTAEAVGPQGAASPYRQAEYVQFCPSGLTHDAVRASPLAIANCPISIFIYEAAADPGRISVGYRLPATTPSLALRAINDKLAALLDEIVVEATSK